MRKFASSHYGNVWPALEQQVPAGWLDPELMAIPERGGAIDSLKFLTAKQANQLMSRRHLAVPPEGCPRPCHKVRPEHEDQTMDRLLTAGLATTLPEDCIPMVSIRKFGFLSGRSACSNMWCLSSSAYKWSFRYCQVAPKTTGYIR